THNSNARTERFNALAVEALEPMGVIINDLYTPISKNIERYICDDRIHMTPEGVEYSAKLVAGKIKEALGN
ncbi:MAG: SGNH/GDSL hydrolase family protein, partial [Clostridia bacterium]|nr:SGNH/GDSL hydrolase family protein [Clostridia bacterium]